MVPGAVTITTCRTLAMRGLCSRLRSARISLPLLPSPRALPQTCAQYQQGTYIAAWNNASRCFEENASNLCEVLLSDDYCCNRFIDVQRTMLAEANSNTVCQRTRAPHVHICVCMSRKLACFTFYVCISTITTPGSQRPVFRSGHPSKY